MTPILEKIKELNIEIALLNGSLEINAPKGVMNKTLLEEIRVEKENIINAIKDEREKHIYDYHKDIKQVAIVDDANGNLVAFYSSVFKINNSLIIEYLSKIIPNHMIPKVFVKLDKLPLTSTNEIDREKLKQFEIYRQEGYKEPKSKLEKELAAIWEVVFDRKGISIDNSLFEIGGHSLHVVQIINKIKKDLQLDVKYKEIFQNSSIEALAEYLNNKNSSNANDIVIPRVNLESPVPLSSSQYRLWVTAQLGGTKSYNIPIVFEITGNFEPSHFEKSIYALLERHEILRCYFKVDDNNKVLQYIETPEDLKLDFQYEDVITDEDTVKRKVNEVTDQEFDLEKPPLIKTGAFKVGENRYIIYLILHHLITDGWSMQVFFKEALDHINSFIETGKPAQLPPLDIQFSDYVYWINNSIEGAMDEQKRFWHNVFKDPMPLVRLPFERKDRPLKKTYNGKSIRTKLNPKALSLVNDICHEYKITPFSVLMALFKLLLHKYTNLTDFTIGTPISGRINEQLEKQIGLYLNTLPIRTKFELTDNINTVVKEEANRLIGFYDNQLYQMDDLIKDLDIKTYQGRSPLFDFMLAFQNQNSVNIFNNYHDNKEIEIRAWEKVDYKQSQFDLSIAFAQNNFNDVDFAVSYNIDVFQGHHIESMMKDYVLLIEKALSNRESSVKDLMESIEHEFLTDKEIEFNPINTSTVDSNQESDEYFNQNDEIILALKRILKGNLSEQIEAKDDYFEIGGSSLGAINIVRQLNQEFDKNFSIIDFYNHPSIIQLHNFITKNESGGDENSSDQKIISSWNTPETTKPNAFQFPPILGLSLVYNSLNTHLESLFNLYQIDIPLLNGAENLTSELILNIYAELSGLLSKKETNYFIGYSVGCNYAFEITKIAEADGYPIEIIMIDRSPEITYRPKITKRLIRRFQKEYEVFIGYAKQLGYEEELLKRNIEQTLHFFNDYTVEGKVNAKINSFECTDNGEVGYMKLWNDYSNKNGEVTILKGDHLEALSPENIITISTFFKEI